MSGSPPAPNAGTVVENEPNKDQTEVDTTDKQTIEHDGLSNNKDKPDQVEHDGLSNDKDKPDQVDHDGLSNDKDKFGQETKTVPENDTQEELALQTPSVNCDQGASSSGPASPVDSCRIYLVQEDGQAYMGVSDFNFTTDDFFGQIDEDGPEQTSLFGPPTSPKQKPSLGPSTSS